jgi:hypothetical protein
MSDYASSLPIRSEVDGLDARVQVKVVDATNPGTQQLIVDTDGNAHIEMHGNTPAGTDVVQTLTEEGRTTSRGDYDATTNTKPSSNAVLIHSRQTTPTEVHQTFRPTGINSSVNTSVWAQDVAIRDEDGNPFTANNPFPVTISDSEGVEVNNYNTSAAVLAAASSNHDYTVTALKTLKLSQIVVAASGRIKVEVQVETAAASGVFNTVFVQFNSTSNTNIIIPINENISVVAGAKVRVIRTNRDLLAQDVYSTICGHEI